jgi:hypothetical protein
MPRRAPYYEVLFVMLDCLISITSRSIRHQYLIGLDQIGLTVHASGVSVTIDPTVWRHRTL